MKGKEKKQERNRIEKEIEAQEDKIMLSESLRREEEELNKKRKL